MKLDKSWYVSGNSTNQEYRFRLFPNQFSLDFKMVRRDESQLLKQLFRRKKMADDNNKKQKTFEYPESTS